MSFPCRLIAWVGDKADILRMCARNRSPRSKGAGEMAKKSTSAAYRKLKKALTDNLVARGLIETMYTDKVEEYMDLWQRRRELEADIETRGVCVMDEKRGMLVENRSVSLEVQVSRQMLAIYSALGFKDDGLNAKRVDDEDDEL